ncbi:MAG: hypothetical protein KME43_12175 [Myxacorys chilensis ATA2-1-KO14]|nr:hypothetical protein [Myxacorys chilensis ATA2-1-KO14]
MTDPVRKSNNHKAFQEEIANLELQIGQFILGASQRSAQESAGSHCRFRFNFISRYQSGRQGYPANENGFNVFVTCY